MALLETETANLRRKVARYKQMMANTFITDVTAWEDYDNEIPEPNQRIGFKLNFEENKQD